MYQDRFSYLDNCHLAKGNKPRKPAPIAAPREQVATGRFASEFQAKPSKGNWEYRLLASPLPHKAGPAGVPSRVGGP